MPPWKSTMCGPLPLVLTAIGGASMVVIALENSERSADTACGLADGGEDLPADLHRLRVDEDDREDAGHSAAIDPVVDRAPLHHDVPGREVDDGAVQLHVDLARDDHDVIDRIGAAM